MDLLHLWSFFFFLWVNPATPFDPDTSPYMGTSTINQPLCPWQLEMEGDDQRRATFGGGKDWIWEDEWDGEETIVCWKDSVLWERLWCFPARPLIVWPSPLFSPPFSLIRHSHTHIRGCLFFFFSCFMHWIAGCSSGADKKKKKKNNNYAKQVLRGSGSKQILWITVK